MRDCVSSAPPPPSFLPRNRRLASTASYPTPRAGQFATRHCLSFRNPPHAGHPTAKSVGGASGRSADFGSRDREFYGRLGLKDDGEERFELETNRGSDAGSREGSGGGGSDAAEGGNLGTEKPARSGEEEEEALRSEGGDAGVALRSEEESQSKLRVRGGRQVIRRSSMVAKQVISIESALGLGFVSQLWVDTASVGDVVLVENERVMENELKMVGLETLVSTYALFVEDVLEVASDKVFVHEAAAARLQRLTKGWWGPQNVRKSFNAVEEYYDLEEDDRLPNDSRTRRGFRRRRSRPKARDDQDDLDLPMDFL
ncbi:hypothetical protein BT93_K1532 [Corymbia citriodora subsp. variegata]|nr:hypothetical protein BT93_K1532 [Corymbia citriodora subsp. variegata]